MVFSLAIMAQKGGAGKTTLALHLYGAALRRRPALFDLDPQQSAAKWAARRAAAHPEAPPAAVAALDPRQLGARLRQLAGDDCGLAILDTSPRADASAAIVAQFADLVLIPCRPSALDLDAVGSTIEIARLARKPAQIVINAAPPVGRLAGEAIAALRAAGYPVLDRVVAQRAALAHALNSGATIGEYAPASKAAAEIAGLFAELATRFPGGPRPSTPRRRPRPLPAEERNA
jgi:chromosome partitioning protein